MMDNPEERSVKDLLGAPCLFCGYNGANYWQTASHAQLCPWYHVGGSYERAYIFRDEVIGMWGEKIIAERGRFDERCPYCETKIDVHDHFVSHDHARSFVMECPNPACQKEIDVDAIPEFRLS